MSLKARLKRLEAQVEWLEVDGMLRLCELKLELIDKERQIADHLAANPEAAALFAAAGITFIRPPPRPAPPPPVDLVKEITSPARASEGTEGGGPPRLRSAQAPGRRGTRSLNTKIATVMTIESPSALRAPPPAEEAIVRPSPPEPEQLTPSPETKVRSHDPPEENYYGYRADF